MRSENTRDPVDGDAVLGREPGAQMIQALMSGAIDATLPNVSEGGSQVQDGTFRALAVMAEKRLADYPDVPSTYELGYEFKPDRYLISPEDSVAGHEVWDKHIKEEYRKAVAALKDLGEIK